MLRCEGGFESPHVMTRRLTPQAAGSAETQSDKHTNKMIEQKKLT